MSIRRNRARLDLQLYLEIPDDVLNEHNKPGFKADAITVLNKLVSTSVSKDDLLERVTPYVLEVRSKTSGGNIQLARDTHLKGEALP